MLVEDSSHRSAVESVSEAVYSPSDHDPELRARLAKLKACAISYNQELARITRELKQLQASMQ